MDMPAALRSALEALLDGVPASELARSSETLSRRYRDEVRDGAAHLATPSAALAYVATRMPATFAAAHRALSETALAQPDLAPASLLDVGAGPGTLLWATQAVWPHLQSAELIEPSPAIRAIGEQLTGAIDPLKVAWRPGDARQALASAAPADLVTAGYVLNELKPEDRAPVIDRLWSLTRQVLVVVEPGTSAGWRRILQVRAQVLASGGRILAPCPHAQDCPLVDPDWCHFSQRLARSRRHRLAKRAEVPFEDEKFIYVALARAPSPAQPARVLAPPRPAKPHIDLKLCQPDGTADVLRVPRRDPETYRIARRLDWGDRFEP
jgi:ribosomal protein RSM22 (predicted rRNA methylase)